MADDDSQLRARVVAALDRALRRAAGNSLAGARNAFGELSTRFRAPMRVAIVGRVSSGKSTLVNALLGGQVVPTDVEELTYNVNWLRYAPVPGLTVHFKDGRPPQQRDPAEWEALTVRSDQSRERLDEIDYLVISESNPYLKAFDLIDTPGLDSHFSDDSANTMRFLGLSEAGVRDTTMAHAADATIAHAAKADALVLVFPRGAAEKDVKLLREFQMAGPMMSAASPLTAVGVLTKIEHYWDPPDQPDPVAAGRRLAERMMSEGEAGRYLYQLYPLATLVGEAAATFDAENFADLTALAAIDPLVLEDAVGLGSGFGAADAVGLPVPADRRRVLFDRFSAYGIALACQLIRDGIADEDTLKAELTERSGMAEFRRSLVSHFGNRADLIKLQQLIGQVRAIPATLGNQLQPRDRAALDRAVAEVSQLEFKEHAFSELALLRAFYAGRLSLGDQDAADLRRIFGETGTSAAARLGLLETAAVEELRARARERHSYWSTKSVEALPGPEHHAARVLRRSYEGLIGDIGLISDIEAS